MPQPRLAYIAEQPEALLILMGQWKRPAWIWELIGSMPNQSIVLRTGKKMADYQVVNRACEALRVDLIEVIQRMPSDIYGTYRRVADARTPVVATFGRLDPQSKAIAELAKRDGLEVIVGISEPLPGGLPRLGAAMGNGDTRMLVFPIGNVEAGKYAEIDREVVYIESMIQLLGDEAVCTVTRGCDKSDATAHVVGSIVKLEAK